MRGEASTSAEAHSGGGWRETLAALGISPSKARGQNFLHDRRIVERIVEAAGIHPDDTVLEIGPGLGVMTVELACRATRVVAVEIDPRLAGHLRSVVPGNVEIVEDDALRVDFASLVGPRYLVVANLPYSVATAIIRRLQETIPPPQSLTVMVQREVAERICAAPPDMSLLSVGVQFFGTPRLLFRVGGGAFVPPPKVESAVIRIEAHEPPLPPAKWEPFFRIVAAGFGQRRKQLQNGLSSGLGIEREYVSAALRAAEVNPAARAETLAVADWVRIHRAIANRSEE